MGRIQSVGLSTQYTNALCSPFCHSPKCATKSSPQNILTCDLALGQDTVHDLIELSLKELCNVRESAALQSHVAYVAFWSLAFSSRAWLHEARGYVDSGG